MERTIIIEKIETGAHHFLESIRIEYAGTKEAGGIVHKYMKGEKITEEEEHILKVQLVDSLKIVGIGIPFVLVPGASILMPILIKVAEKHNIQLMPSACNRKDDTPSIDEAKD